MTATKADAVAACAVHGMHLWAPNTEQEEDYIRDFIDDHPGKSNLRTGRMKGDCVLFSGYVYTLQG